MNRKEAGSVGVVCWVGPGVASLLSVGELLVAFKGRMSCVDITLVAGCVILLKQAQINLDS